MPGVVGFLATFLQMYEGISQQQQQQRPFNGL